MKEKKNKKKVQNGDRSSLFEKKVDRREFLEKGTKMGIAASLFGSGALFSVPPAQAAKSLKGKGEVIVCGWGGGFQDAMRKTILEPFTKETGIKVIDTATPSAGKVKAQVDSGNVEWDVAILGVTSNYIPGPKYLEKIDYSYFDPEDYKAIPEGYRTKLTVAAYFYSYILAYRTDKFPQGVPKTWVDFADFKRYPGKRIFPRSHGAGFMHVQIAQVGMGVPIDKVKKGPVDMDKVWAFYNKIKPHVIKWWSQGAQAPQMLKNAEVHMACGYSSRIQKMVDAGEPINYSWHGGEISDNSYVVLKNSPNPENAMKFLAFACRPEPQAKWADLYPYGPSNARAIQYVKPETKPKLNTAPENFKLQAIPPWDFMYQKTLDPKGEKFNRYYLADKWQAWALQ